GALFLDSARCRRAGPRKTRSFTRGFTRNCPWRSLDNPRHGAAQHGNLQRANPLHRRERGEEARRGPGTYRPEDWKDVAMAPTFGHLLRQHRKAAGLTQEELAEHA